MKSIIVATDFSKSAEVALGYAVQIATLTNAKITLFNIYSADIHALNGCISAKSLSKLFDANKKKLKKYAKQLSDKYNIPLSTYSTTNTLVEETLKELTVEIGADLVVMGLKSNHDEMIRSGYTISSVLKYSRLPLLLIPEDVEIKSPERVLFACDYHILPDNSKLYDLKSLVSAFKAELQICHVGDLPITLLEGAVKQEPLIERLEHTIDPVKHSYQNVERKDIIGGLIEGVEKFKADVIVMAPHKYGFFHSMFHKSITKAMMYRTHIPLLSLPA